MEALVLCRGGVDSSTCRAIAVEKYGADEVLCLSVSYGQKHSKELDAAKAVADYYGVKLKTLDLSSIFEESDCSLLKGSDKEIPLESYSEQLKKTDGAPVSTYVPFRNGLFLSCAASVALSFRCEEIFYGAHSDDAAGNAYPDCSQDFNDSINRAIYLGSGNRLRVTAPFIGMNKSQVVKRGLSLKVPYELTWSCYSGHDKPCGVCGTCRDRIAAFESNGVTDPLIK